MIERTRETPDPKRPATEGRSGQKVDVEIDLAAVFGERDVPLEEVLEYGVGSVIDLGSVEEVRVSVRWGPVEVARGTVVTISDGETAELPRGETGAEEEAADRRPRPRLGVRVEELSTRAREEDQND